MCGHFDDYGFEIDRCGGSQLNVGAFIFFVSLSLQNFPLLQTYFQIFAYFTVHGMW